ncbi:MAG: hydantoinase/oxoprolinase family protein [Deltaproteobacteria bacterium]|nr:hydantoinase/oxoprolinase family protein [Deltaproteobacteria bacterium]
MIIGLDVGGTHTDAALISHGQVANHAKVRTDYKDLYSSVMGALDQVLDGVDVADLARIVFSTTLATNSVVQGKEDPAALIISAGPGLDPTNFLPTRDYYVVKGGIDHRGREIQPINPEEIRSIAREIHENYLTCLGVAGKFSTRNPTHELDIKKALGDGFQYIATGHTVSGNLNFPRRMITTYLNAAIYRTHKMFFDAVDRSLASRKITAPIYILKADGGTMGLHQSLDYSAQTILSGPAASVMGVLGLANTEEEAVVLDIGGTTTDIAVLADGVPLLEPLGITLGPYKTLIRALYSKSVGIGGDSCVRINMGKVTIGPDRAGPARAFGGPQPTPTDAMVVMGLVKIGDHDRAVAGITGLAEILKVRVEYAAELIVNTTCRNIVNEVNIVIKQINSQPVYTIHEFLEGKVIRPRKIIIIGGPAPHLAPRLRELFRTATTVPEHYDVANAVGAGIARTTTEITLNVDTEREVLYCPEEQLRENVSSNFTKKDAIRVAFDLLTKRARRMGALEEKIDMELVEDMEFNIVRNFYTTGKNIRIKAQVKPGITSKFFA